MSGESALRFDGLTCRYDDIVAVDGLSLQVRDGEMFGFIGPDGAGKTTSLRAALGLVAADSGSVRTCGLDPRRDRQALAARVGYLSQRFSLYGDLSVDENISFFANIHGVSGWRQRRDELLEMVRMEEFRGRLADRLSGGMRQKLALACTLIHTPELLILDEPTTGVDPVSRRDFWKLLAGLQADGLTIVMTTPYLDEAERCQRVALMFQGRLLAIDDPQRLRATFPGVVVELSVRRGRESAAALRLLDGVDQVEVFGHRLHVFLPTRDPDQGGAEARRLEAALREEGFAIDACRAVKASLEDVFIARIREQEAEAGQEVAA